MRTIQLLILLTVVTLILSTTSCSINKYQNNVRVGKWVTKYTHENVTYRRIEYYDKGKEKGTWRVYANKSLELKEKYKRDTCYTTFYYPNKKINSKGRTVKKRENDGSLHWFYTGDWNFYDKKANLVLIRNYVNGLPVSEIEVRK